MQDNRKDRTLMQALMDQLRRILRKKQFPSEGDPTLTSGLLCGVARKGAAAQRPPRLKRIRTGASRRGVSSASRIVHFPRNEARSRSRFSHFRFRQTMESSVGRR